MSNNNKKFDQQKKAATGTGFPVKVQFRGHTYKVLAQEEWTIDLLENLARCEENPLMIVFVIKELLGPEYNSFKQRVGNKASALNEFFEAIQRQMGTEGPN